MSVDYEYCQNCGECKPDTLVHTTILNNREINLCIKCIGNMDIICVDDVELPNLTEDQKEDIENYGSIYFSTKDHLLELIDDNIKQINDLKEENEELKELYESNGEWE